MSGKCNLLLSIIYYLLPITLFSLEDSTTLLCSFAFGWVRTRSKGSRITPMRRIKPPSCPPLGMKGLALATWVSSWQSVTKEKPLQGGGGEGLKIRRIWVIRDWFWIWRASQRRVSASMGYCLPDSITSISFSNPETASRVTLATLGTGFQPALLSCCLVACW